MVTTPLLGRRPWDSVGSFREGTLIPLKSLWALPTPRKGIAKTPQLREEGLQEAEPLGAVLPLLHDDLGETDTTRLASAWIERSEEKATSMPDHLPFSLRRKMDPAPDRSEDGEPRLGNNGNNSKGRRRRRIGFITHGARVKLVFGIRFNVNKGNYLEII